jgi:hypothetical protein
MPAIICKNKSQENGTFPEYSVAERRLSAILDGMAKKPDQRRAYSYIRFSSAEQEKGDSLHRQIELRDKILAQHPEWILDKTPLQDLGVSAWEGANITEGALGLFIAACEAGKILPGSILIIEQWDRLSRLPAIEAMELFFKNCPAWN